jgi:putative ABC transport system permease protein
MIGVNFNIALEALWANRLRSMLTALGIFIGVAAVIAALTLTQGAGASINARFNRVGPTVITVRNGTANSRGAFGAGGTVQSLTPADANAIRQQVAHVAYVSPVVSAGEQIVYGKQNENTTVQGVSPDYQTIQDWTLSEGLWYSTTDQTSGKPVAVIGQSVAQNLFAPSGTDPLNQTIRIGNQLFRVIGVLQAKGSGSFASADDVIYVPYTTALDRLKSTPYVDQILVAADTTDNVNQVQQDLTTLLEQRHHITKGSQDDFQSESSAELLQAANQLTTTITLLLVGIASISLTVGGIGIMNIMIVSVTERTREIGIRMSIGARRKDIRNQFLIEALTLSLVGGVIGMLLGLLVGYIVTKLTGLAFILSPTSILTPFIVSAAIGIAFGLYPAVRASRLDPIVALRTD